MILKLNKEELEVLMRLSHVKFKEENLMNMGDSLTETGWFVPDEISMELYELLMRELGILESLVKKSAGQIIRGTLNLTALGGRL